MVKNGRRWAGVTLIELMVAITVLSILAAIAAPTYQRYLVQSKIASVLPMMDPLKQQAIVFYQRYGRFPAAGDPGADPATGVTWSYTTHKYMQYTNGYVCGSQYVINLWLTNNTELGLAANKFITITLTPEANGAITAICGPHGGTTYGAGSTFQSVMPSSCNSLNNPNC